MLTDQQRANLAVQLTAELEIDEGSRLKLYPDSKGIPTIGVGRNLRDVGISLEEEALLLRNDIATHEDACSREFPWFDPLDQVRQRALIDLHFNLGDRLLGFPKFLGHMAAGEFPEAAAELVNSAWYTEVGVRAPRIVQMIEFGTDPFFTVVP